ncbi:MAG TPA: DUF2085 domain-containing protein [Myxococcota bacterium]|nr:DUF2085 domain-containing protein [Myxococcota bacterium]
MSGDPPQPQGFFGLLLSHHPASKLHLCYEIRIGKRSLHFCARCLGLLPAMFLTLFLARLGGPWPEWLVWVMLLLMPLPALVDWGTATASGRPERANWVRLTTGIGLGVGLGASLFINSYALLSTPVKAQFVFLVGSVWVVWLVSYLRRSILRSKRQTARRRKRMSLEEYMLQDNADQGSHPERID